MLFMEDNDYYSSESEGYAEQSGSSYSDIAGVGSDAIRAAQKRKTAEKIKKAASALKQTKKVKTAGSLLAVKNTKIIAIMLLIVFSILFLAVFLYAMPMAAYEILHTFAQNLKNAWDEWLTIYYSGDYSRLGGFFNATFTSIKNSFSSLWDSLFQTKDETDTDDPDDHDLLLIGQEASNINVVQRKVDAVKDKIEARAKMIKDAICSACSANGQITQAVYQQCYAVRDCFLYPSFDPNTYMVGDTFEDNVVEVVFGGVNCSVSSQPFRTKNAVDIIALYSAQHNISTEDIKPYSLMKWLGYRAGNPEPAEFIVGGCVQLSVDGWTGEFKPQYLEDEEKYNPDYDYSGFEAPAIDLLLAVNSTPVSAMQPVVSLVPFQHYEKISEAYTRINTMTLEVPNDMYTFADFVPQAANNGWVTGRLHTDYYWDYDSAGHRCKIPLTYQAISGWIDAMNASRGTRTVTSEYEETVPEQYGMVERNRAVITYCFSASVYTRDTKAVSDLAGFKNYEAVA